ncbi:hypothetical protein KI387_034797, partial [Taxus chinensis]
ELSSVISQKNTVSFRRTLVENSLETEQVAVGKLDNVDSLSSCAGLEQHIGLWLVALFYMLGNTAADSFCCSLEKLSKPLKLPPTVAVVTLVPLGNETPDVFARIAAFIVADAREVELNSVLGVVLVTSVVTGLEALIVTGSNAQIDRCSFVHDICFFLINLASLCLILILRKITSLRIMTFLSIYIIPKMISDSEYEVEYEMGDEMDG